jgi:hypothetical protein
VFVCRDVVFKPRPVRVKLIAATGVSIKLLSEVELQMKWAESSNSSASSGGMGSVAVGFLTNNRAQVRNEAINEAINE